MTETAVVRTHPTREDVSITLPKDFLGKHQIRYSQAIEGGTEAGLPALFTNFGAALAILDDWQIPGLSHNPAEWDFEEIPINVMAWIAEVTLTKYEAAFSVDLN